MTDEPITLEGTLIGIGYSPTDRMDVLYMLIQSDDGRLHHTTRARKKKNGFLQKRPLHEQYLFFLDRLHARVRTSVVAIPPRGPYLAYHALSEYQLVE